jgi:hypothetical protein
MSETTDTAIAKLFTALSKHAEDFIFDLSYDTILGMWSVRVDVSVRLHPLSLAPSLVRSGLGTTLPEAVEAFIENIKAAEAAKDPNV